MLSRIIPLAPALVCLGLLAGCGEEISSVDSNDILLSPSHDDPIVFPRVPVGRSERRNIEIRQGGETDLEVTGIVIEGYENCDRTKLAAEGKTPEDDDQCQLVIDETPMMWNAETGEYDTLVLTKGEFKQLTIQYRPTTLEPPPETRVLIRSNVRKKEEQWVRLQVQGAQPEIATTDGETTVSFAGTMGMQQKTVGIRNVGTGVLIVNDVQLRLKSEPARDPGGQPVPELVVSPREGLPWQIDESQRNEVLVTYTPVDDNDDAADLVFLSNDPNAPEYVVSLTSARVESHLSVEPNPVLFGVIAANTAVRKQITFNNAGLRNLDVLALTIEPAPNPDYKLEANQATSFQLPAGGEKVIEVIYKPTSAAGSDATLLVRTTADNVRGGAAEGTVRLDLRRELAGIGPRLDIDPPQVDLSDVGLGMSETVDITLTSAGDEAVDITAVRLSGAGDETPSDPEFEITGGDDPGTLAPGAEHTIEVTFTRGAADRNAHFGSLIIESNAPSSPDSVTLGSRPLGN